MPEPRKIVLILGNGFDLDLGLKTSYKDFWESEFCPKDYPAPLIHHLNKRWDKNLEAVRWYDLENELLNYYITVQSPQEGTIDIITEEERELLEQFTPYGWACGWFNEKIGLVQSLVDKGILLYRERPLPAMGEHYKEDCLKPPAWRDNKALGLIKQGLYKYLESIEQAVPRSQTVASYVLGAVSRAMTSGDTVEVYSFNYTPVALSAEQRKGLSIHYMHGCCEQRRIIIGTRDDITITSDYDFLQKVMDPYFNPPSLVTTLQDADEVIIFGHSLGENDRQYFAPFFKRQADVSQPTRKEIIFFTRDYKAQAEIKRALQKMTNGNLSALYSINQPRIIKTANIDEDQTLFRDFLLSHDTPIKGVEYIIETLLKKPNTIPQP